MLLSRHSIMIIQADLVEKLPRFNDIGVEVLYGVTTGIVCKTECFLPEDIPDTGDPGYDRVMENSI